MSESSTEPEFDSKEQFIEAVREDGAALNGVEYFTEGEGSATSYMARHEDGEEEAITKSEVEAAWDDVHGDESSDEEGEESEDDEPEEVHLGTFYYSQSHWEGRHREALEAMLDDLGWYIDGEVDSGGYRIKTTE